jgi:hypothetical protein
MTQDEIETLARQLTKVEPDNIEAVIGHLSVDEGGVVRLQSQTMAKRGIADDLIEKDLSALRVRMFAEYRRLVTTHRHGRGDAA